MKFSSGLNVASKLLLVIIFSSTAALASFSIEDSQIFQARYFLKGNAMMKAALMQTVACQLPPMQKTGSISVSGVTDVLAVDVNRDGNQDVIANRSVISGSSIIYPGQTFLGNGSGSFTSVNSNNGLNLQTSDEALVGEFNGDGFPDLYVRRGTQQIQVFVNNGQGQFTLGTEINGTVLSFMIGDVNNDGLDDVVRRAGNYGVYLCNANRTFTKLPIEFGSTGSAVLLDVNGDGKLDLVNSIQTFATTAPMFTWLGNGNGTFQQGDVLILPSYVNIRKVVDFNKDGRPDIVGDLNCTGSADNFTKLYVMLNNGRGNFTPSSRDLPGRPCEVTIKGVGDFNGDGFPEIALADGRIAINDGKGVICAVSEVCCTAAGINSPPVTAIADFNGDNKADVLNIETGVTLALWSSKTSGQNTPPVVTATASQKLRQGYQDGISSTYYLLATVSDAESALADLSVSLSGTPAGITFLNTSIEGGFVRTRLVVGCNVPVGNYPITITIIDTGGLSATTTWLLQVIQKQPPTFTNFTLAPTVNVGGTVEVFSSAQDADGHNLNLSPINLPPVVTIPSPFSGTIEAVGNGLVRIVNAQPVGTHSLTYTATDRCGVQSLVVTVITVTGAVQNTPPTIMLTASSVSQGVSGAVPAFGTVADAQTPAGSLQLSATNVPAGVTLTNLRSVNGAVNADIAVSCSAATGAYQIPIKVTDNGGLGTTANWTLNVNANQAPVLGAYAATNVTGSSIQVTPSFAPTDDGTIASVTVTASSYAGAITVTPAGVVTITNNNIAGTYQATVTATDNCGLKANATVSFTIPAAPPSGCNVPSFQSAGTVAVADPDRLITGDFNNDGFQDVVVIQTKVTISTPASLIYFGNGQGGFNLVQPKSTIDSAINPGDLVKSGDFNGDGYLDLGVLRFNTLIGTRPLYRSLQTLLNDKMGKITSTGSTFNGNVYSFEVGDLNNDGFSDAVVNTGYNNSVLLNNKNNSFTKLPNEFGFPTKMILVRHLSSTFLVNESEGTNFVFLGDNAGGFSPTNFRILGSLQAVADITQSNTIPQIITSRNGQLTIDYGIKSFPEYTSPVLTSADFNGDRIVDLLLADGRVPIFSLSTNTFCGTADFRSQGLTNPAAAADFDGDAKADILTINASGFTLWTSSRGGGTVNTPPQLLGTVTNVLAVQGQSIDIPAFDVKDTETPVDKLVFSVLSTPPGTSVISIKNALSAATPGLFFVRLDVSCAATIGTGEVVIKITDQGGLSVNAKFPVTVTANKPPQIAYPNITLSSSNITINPSSVVDEFAIENWQVTAPGYAGTLSISNGTVTISNNNVAGTYTATVTATDSCGLRTSTNFTFTIPTTTTTGCPAPTFNSALNYNSNTQPYNIASADFNGDQRMDMAVVNGGADTVTIMIRQTDGSFIKNPTTYAVGPWANFVIAVDFNGDGKQDFAVTNRANDTETIFLGAGNGTFTKKGSYEVGNKSTGGAAGDFNNDGKPDLLISNDGSGSVVLLIGNGDGSFKTPKHIGFNVFDSPQPGVIRDFNGDGNLDAAVGLLNSGQVAILLGDGQGNFSTRYVATNLTGISPIAAGDFNGDSRSDLIVVGGNGVAVTLLSNGNGTFVIGGSFSTQGNNVASVTVEDYNKDGKTDVAFAGYSDSEVKVFQGLGNGTFAVNSPTIINVGNHPLGLINIYSGTKPSLAVANNGSGTVTVITNGCSQ